MIPISMDVWLFIFVISTYISAKRIKKNTSYLNSNSIPLYIKILGGLLFIYFNLSIYGVFYLDNYKIDLYPLPSCFFMPMALVWTVPLFLEALHSISRIIETPYPKTKPLTIKQGIIAAVLLMSHYLLWLTAFNPCITSADSDSLYSLAHKVGSVSLENWHPPFYTILMSYLIKICDSISFIVIIQCLCFTILIVRIISYLISKGISVKTAIILYLIWGFAFNNTIQMISLWKDIPYMISILWLTFLICQYVIEHGSVNKYWYIRIIIALIFTAFFRQNGILPAFAVAIALSVSFIKKKKYIELTSVIAFVMIVVMINGPLYSHYSVKNVPGLKYFALANDLLGTYYTIPDPSDELKDLAYEITDDNPDNYYFTSYYTIYNSDALGHYSVHEFLNLYLSTWYNHPVTVTSEFMKRNSVQWSILKPGGEFQFYTNYLGEYTASEYYYPPRINLMLTEMFTIYANTLTDNGFIFVFAWRTGIYSLLLMLLAYILIRKNSVGILLAFVPIIFNSFALYAASGWTDYRYYWPTAVISVLLLPVSRLAITIENK